MSNRFDIATALIAHCEGCRLAPYLDLRGLWTIGFGNRFSIDGSTVRAATQPLQMYQAQQLLRETLLATAPKLAELIKPALSEPEMGALMSLSFNVGLSAFAASTMLRFINRDEITLAAGQFQFWAYADHRLVKGLVARRALERGIYLGVLDPVAFNPVANVPTTPHPALASAVTTYELSADDLNARQLALLRPSVTATPA